MGWSIATRVPFLLSEISRQKWDTWCYIFWHDLIDGMKYFVAFINILKMFKSMSKVSAGFKSFGLVGRGYYLAFCRLTPIPTFRWNYKFFENFLVWEVKKWALCVFVHWCRQKCLAEKIQNFSKWCGGTWNFLWKL